MRKSHWNYRIIDHGSWFGIHEVYYTNGIADSWSEDAVKMTSEDVRDLYDIVNDMGKMFLEPVFTIKDDKLVEGNKGFLFMLNNKLI